MLMLDVLQRDILHLMLNVLQRDILHVNA